MLGTGDKQVLHFPLLYRSGFLGILCCQKVAGTLPSIGKLLTISSEDFPFCSKAGMVNVLHKAVNTAQSVSFFCFEHQGFRLLPIIFLEESFILITKPVKFVSDKSFFDGTKNCVVHCCSAVVAES